MTETLTIRLPKRLRAARVLPGPSPQAEGGTPAPAAQADVQVELQRRAEENRQQVERDRAQLAAARDALVDAAGKLAEYQAAIFAQAEGQLVDLAVEIARKVVMQEVEADRVRIAPIVREALSGLPKGGAAEVIVRLNPEDLKRCELSAEGGDAVAGRVRFVADPAVGRAECVLETPEGVIESSPQSHLAEIADVLKGEE